MARGDDNFEILNINFKYSFFKTNYTQMTVSTNGFLFFASPFSSCCNIIRPATSNLISPLNYDLITSASGGGNVFYKSLNQSASSNDLITIQNEINQLFKPQTNFTAKNAFVISYADAKSYYNSSDVTTFQIILSTDFIRSYVTISYDLCLTKTVGLPPKSEINCLNKTNSLFEKYIVNPCSSSNVNLPGKWIFDVTNDCNLNKLNYAILRL